jgi:transcriptional regulator of acetoin/glycerol metabolism
VKMALGHGLESVWEAEVRVFAPDGELRSWNDIEADVIRYAYVSCRGQVREMARRLDVSHATLYRRLHELGLCSSDGETVGAFQ